MDILRFFFIPAFIILILFSCTPSRRTANLPVKPSNQPSVNNNFIEALLQNHPEYFDTLLKQRDEWNIQIVYTRIDRKADNTPVMQDFYYNTAANAYFYPASTVKMPIAFLALQRLNELNKKGLDKYTTMITDAASPVQTGVYNDPTSADGSPSVAQYIKKIFLVSDNDAFNRLYELLGQEYINNTLGAMGYTDAQILHRLSLPLSEADNRHTNPISFTDTAGTTIYEQPDQVSKLKYIYRNDRKGKGYYSGNRLVNEPFDFSAKNRISLPSLHNILKSVIFPEAVMPRQRFNLTSDDRQFLLEYMSKLPGESIHPSYDSTEIWDTYVKFLLAGSQKGGLPPDVRIFNKVGDAYGFLIDVAYIIDVKEKVEFMLSAVIHCNTDGIYNDDQYDYDRVGLPFMRNLGKVMYEYELKRPREQKPDLSAFEQKK
jgi:Beta-lactamase enzyme family